MKPDINIALLNAAQEILIDLAHSLRMNMRDLV